MSELLLGHRIATLREHKGLSQSALARLAGMDQSAISLYEKGSRNPSYTTLRSIAKALGMTTTELLHEESDEARVVESAIPAHEEAHFRLFRSLTPEAQKELEDFALYLRKKDQMKAAG